MSFCADFADGNVVRVHVVFVLQISNLIVDYCRSTINLFIRIKVNVA